MIVCVLLPDLALHCALARARCPRDAVAVLGPAPGTPQVVSIPTASARAQGIRPGLRVGEALARCPHLQIVPPDEAAVADTHEQLLQRLEGLGAAVEPGAQAGTALFTADGLYRLYGGMGGVMSRVRAVLPVGLEGRVGAAPARFAATQAAEAASSAQPRVVHDDALASFMAPLPVDRLSLPPRTVASLRDLGITTVGGLAALSHAHALEHLGFSEIAAWRCARGQDRAPVQPRRPAQTLQARIDFPDPVGALPTLQSALRLLLNDLAAQARARGRGLCTVTIRARTEGDGSWSHTITLREAHADPDRLAVGCLPLMERVCAPVTELVVSGDASGEASQQLSVLRIGAHERAHRMHRAAGQVRVRMGEQALMRAVEMEPWSLLPEHRWALVPFDTSPHRDPYA